MKKIKKLIPLFISLLVFVLTLVLTKTGVFSFLELKNYDSRMKFTSRFRTRSDDVILILVNQDSIDEASEKYGWSWPWPRSAWGDIFQFMDKGKAASCTYDILFTEPSIYDSEDDDVFANKLASGENTKSYIAQFWNGKKNDSVKITKPIEELQKAASFISNTTSIEDSDGIIRRSRIQDVVNGENLVYMAFAPVIEDEDFEERIPAEYDKKAGTKAVKLTFKSGIDYYPRYSAMEVLQSIDSIEAGEEPFLEPENFENAHVFVMYYAPGLFDICSSPMSKVYPGAGIAITGLDNYLTGDFMRTVPGWINILVLLAVCFAGVYLSVFSSKQKSSLKIVLSNVFFFILGVMLIWASAYGLFLAKWDLLFLSPLAAFILSFLSNAAVDYFMEGKQKRFIKSAFSQYLSPAVIDSLITNPDALKLGGEKRNITIFFSDVQSFTTLSEKLSPEELTSLLNVYLSTMTDIILSSGGTIDKYEGDAIIAFWNAPADIPGHSAIALKAAVECQEKLAQMEKFFEDMVGRPMWTRMGINTGDAVVGNMGSEKRFDYTMFGDSVNLASRLEGINKQFGTYLICSENTKNQAQEWGTDLFFRELGKVQVVGKTEAVQIFEPMTPDQADSKKSDLENFAKGLSLFYEGNLAEAEKVFAASKDDAPSVRYAEKCRELISSGTACNGIWIASSK